MKINTSKFAALPIGYKIISGTGVVILAVLVIIFLYNKSQHSNKVSDSSTATQACSLPKVEVKESAFTIGVPKNWLYELNNGTISIMKDKSNTEGAFLYTAILKKDISVADFLTTSAGFFTKSVATEGGTFKVIDVKSEKDKASGTIVASLNNIDITGSYSVAKEGNFVTLRAYYAPVSDIDQSRKNLEETVGCFTRTTVLNDSDIAAVKAKQEKTGTTSGLSKYTGKYFSTLLPSDFKVTGETDSGLDMSRNDMAAGFSYAYVTGAKGPYTPKSWGEYALPKYANIQSLSLGDGSTVKSDIPDMTVQAFDFTGLLAGSTDVKGKVTVGVINTTDLGLGSSASAFWAIQIAKPSVWSSVAEELQQIQDSLTIIDIGDTRRKTMLPPNRPMESSTSGSSITSNGESVSSESSQNWADAMRGYTETESPSTGDKFDVSLNSWNTGGPDGPGYYRDLPSGDLEKLTTSE